MNNINKAPFAYIGGKFKLLPQILPLFPENIDVFLDIFGGGADVVTNVNANHKIYNDKCWQVCNLLQTIKTNPNFQKEVEDFILKWRLSKTNVKEYNDLRALYNINYEVADSKQAMLFFLLICYSFNHMIQFNKKGEFNVPFGKERSSYNKSTKQNLERFAKNIKNVGIECMDFEDFINGYLAVPDNSRKLFYADPDYSLSDSSYRRCSELKWTEGHDLRLFSLLDKIHNNGAKFAMSNVLESKGKTNQNLKFWLDNNPDYVVHYLDKSYENCNYQRNERGKDLEVLVCNYK